VLDFALSSLPLPMKQLRLLTVHPKLVFDLNALHSSMKATCWIAERCLMRLQRCMAEL
jgi:hypothetical protein